MFPNFYIIYFTFHKWKEKKIPLLFRFCIYFFLNNLIYYVQFYLYPPIHVQDIRIRAQLHFIVIGFGIRLVAFLLSFCSQLMANLRLLISSQVRAAKWSCVINQVFRQRCSTNPSFSSIKSTLPDSIVKTRVSYM